MKFLSLLFLILLIGCKPKEDKPELDFVKIDIYPIMHEVSSSISIDLLNGIIIFDNYSQLPYYPEEGDTINIKKKFPLNFEYIKLNENEFKDIKVLLGKNFVSDIKKFNTDYTIDKNSSSYLYGEGKRFRINYAKDSTTFATDDFLILDGHNERKIYEVLKIIKKHTKSTNNKKYIKYLSFPYEE